jgi:ParB-like chromosome segregation protein Spo0J
VQIVPRERLSANDYNPNYVLTDNLDLLTRSILVNGWTLPIVCTAEFVIIDGFHRWLVSGREPLLSKLDGLVPVVIVQHDDPAKNVYGTITHNRARGVHQLGPMKAVVKRLLDAGKTVDEIGRELGMRGEEVFRLSDFSRADFLELMARNVQGYSPAKILVRT